MLLRVHALLAAAGMMLASGVVGRSAEPTSLPVEINAGDVIRDRFMGFGAEWDCPGYDRAGVTDKDFAVIRNRID